MFAAIEATDLVASSSIHSAAAELGRVLHRSESRARMICALKAYLDESGIHSGSRICAIAGFVGEQDEWERIEVQWNRVLMDEGIDAFHIVEKCSLSRSDRLTPTPPARTL